MVLSQNDMLRRILETKAVSVWDRKNGPIFWYAANVPGPFYVNTELLLGPVLSVPLLEGITAIVAKAGTAGERAEKLRALVMASYEKDSFFRDLIETMEAKAREVFPSGSYSLLSGGERRDWLFSIPLAFRLGVPHVFLFKNGGLFCSSPVRAGTAALHVSDLINNGASYFNAWLPILEKNGVSCTGTLCVNTRGDNGVKRLEAIGTQVVALNEINIGFFESCRKNGLIDAATLEEMRTFFRSPKEWASAYVMDRPDLFALPELDEKSFERLAAFFTTDPWGLRCKHDTFFAETEKAIRARRAMKG